MGSARGPVPVAVALGSNLGNRGQRLQQACQELASLLDRFRASDPIESDPVGVGAQPRFLNAAATGLTTLPPHALLDALRAIETRLGRERPFAGAPRTIDLDLVLYGDLVIATPTLTVPHPRFRERAFVLGPLAEVAGDWLDPVTGRTVADLLRALPDI